MLDDICVHENVIGTEIASVFITGVKLSGDESSINGLFNSIVCFINDGSLFASSRVVSIKVVILTLRLKLNDLSLLVVHK